MKYRSRSDIVSQILGSANGGATKTEIMYRAYLSYTQLKEYLAVLVENGLVEYTGSMEGTYRTTAKGLQFLKTYEQMERIMTVTTTEPASATA